MERETMKRSGLVLGLLLILSVGILAWRGTANKLTAAEIEKMDMQEPLLASYYEGQESKAYKMLQKSILRSFWISGRERMSIIRSGIMTALPHISCRIPTGIPCLPEQKSIAVHTPRIMESTVLL